MLRYGMTLAMALLATTTSSAMGGNLAPLSQTRQTAAIEQAHDYPTWWKEAVFYQVYPRSFKDSNGDGIGDLNGIIEKLDYLKSLGVNAIWINPHYDSPNVDNGYDIRDYRKIMKEYGTMADFDRLIAEMKKRNMHLMIDIVINHTSDQNAWFVASKSSRDNPYRDYYFWRDGKDDQAPNNYLSFFGGSAWQFEPETGQYYLHYFAKQQPDLNWDNPRVREDLYAMLRFWLDKGVSGLRFDTIATISKIPSFPDLTPQQLQNFAEAYTHGPNLHRYIHEMNREVFSHYDVATAGELFGIPLSQVPLFVDRRREELDMAFTFDLIRVDRCTNERWRRKDWTLSEFRHIIDQLDDIAGNYGWNAIFLANHDNPRAVSKFGDDSPQWRAPSAKALGTLLLTQRATPFIYQGQELGMTNYPFKKLSDFDDIEVKGQWRDYVETGKVSADEFLNNVKLTSRDNSRTPFQWDDSPNAGFTSGIPWMKVNPNYTEINAASELNDPNSIYHYYAKLIKIRHATPALIYGAYHDLDPENNDVYAYTRILGTEKYLVVINFKEIPIRYTLPDSLSIDSVITESNARDPVTKNAAALNLQPWQAGIYKLN